MKNQKRKRNSQVPELDDRHYTAIYLLTRNIKERWPKWLIAKHLNVHPSTLYRWQQRKDFQRIMEEEVRKLFKASLELSPITRKHYTITDDVTFMENVLRSAGFIK
ncbi:phBC6A51 family helix-turn-helix protein [Sutcliffiella horikoshii]|uniref:phBC6A51 family helix-turn-helix protein n=1 Tax=Sutcliffiella horikoshii TaxID=79883 RepID=UPI00384A9597